MGWRLYLGCHMDETDKDLYFYFLVDLFLLECNLSVSAHFVPQKCLASFQMMPPSREEQKKDRFPFMLAGEIEKKPPPPGGNKTS